MKTARFKRFAFLLLIYTIIVILWGAWVRISHSGDGCGDTWPLCNGQLIPEAERGKTWVEYTHRLMSGIYGLIVIAFWWVSRKIYEKGHLARTAALFTLIFTISEALLGAKLVLFGLVTDNDTPYRAFIMALHQLNSFILTASVAISFEAASLNKVLPKKSKVHRLQQRLPWIIVIIGITGAWASLSNTLFPTQDLWSELLADFSSDSHFLVRLRGLHPVLATLGAGGLALYFWVQAQTSEAMDIQRRSYQMAISIAAAILFGFFTLILHAPVWMKITHLALAHTIWVLLVQWAVFMRSKPLTDA